MQFNGDYEIMKFPVESSSISLLEYLETVLKVEVKKSSLQGIKSGGEDDPGY